jgi:predicted dehydrogenase
MNRHQFFNNSKVAAASTLAAAALPSESYAKRSPNDVINVAVVGIHGRGKSHFNNLAEIPDARVSHVVDPDARLFGEHLTKLKDGTTENPATETDLRRVLDNKDVDAISIATPNHWHSLQVIWACQAGKDVYVEKPISHNVWEGRKAVEAARKYNRIVQTGTQNRSKYGIMQAMKFMHEGGIGKLHMAKGFCHKARSPIGLKPPTSVPDGLDYDIWKGPGPDCDFNENLVHYNWHWNWDFGNTDLGNQGIHQMDLMRWGMNTYEYPERIHCVGGLHQDGSATNEQTPNIQHITFEFGDGTTQMFQVHNWHIFPFHGEKTGNVYFGSEGYLEIVGYGKQIRTFFGRNNEPGPTFHDLVEPPNDRPGQDAHTVNFLDAMRSRDGQSLNGDIRDGHLSSAMCHLGNISYRLKRELTFDSHSEQFVGDEQANAHLTRQYRYPYIVPENV